MSFDILEYETASYAHKRMALPTKTHLTCSRKCKKQDQDRKRKQTSTKNS